MIKYFYVKGEKLVEKLEVNWFHKFTKTKYFVLFYAARLSPQIQSDRTTKNNFLWDFCEILLNHHKNNQSISLFSLSLKVSLCQS